MTCPSCEESQNLKDATIERLAQREAETNTREVVARELWREISDLILKIRLDLGRLEKLNRARLSFYSGTLASGHPAFDGKN